MRSSGENGGLLSRGEACLDGSIARSGRRVLPF
jgi:hypothetical protein